MLWLFTTVTMTTTRIMTPKAAGRRSPPSLHGSFVGVLLEGSLARLRAPKAPGGRVSRVFYLTRPPGRKMEADLRF